MSRWTVIQLPWWWLIKKEPARSNMVWRDKTIHTSQQWFHLYLWFSVRRQILALKLPVSPYQVTTKQQNKQTNKLTRLKQRWRYQVIKCHAYLRLLMYYPCELSVWELFFSTGVGMVWYVYHNLLYELLRISPRGRRQPKNLGTFTPVCRPYLCCSDCKWIRV